MTRKELNYYLVRAGLGSSFSKYSDADYVNVSCPFAHYSHKNGTDNNPSMMIKVDPVNPTSFVCFSCGAHGEFWFLLEQLAVLSGKESFRDISAEVFKAEITNANTLSVLSAKYLPTEIHDVEHLPLLLTQFEKMSENMPALAIKYLTQRQIDVKLIQEFRLRYDRMGQRIVLPAWNTDKFVGMVGRTIDKSNELRYKNYEGSNLSHSLGKRENFNRRAVTVIIVEGMFDMLKTYQNLQCIRITDTEVICTFKAIPSSYQIDLIKGLNMEPICFYDNGEAGIKGGEKLQKHLNCRRILPLGDSDAGDTTPTELEKLLTEKNENTNLRRLQDVMVETRWI